MNANFLHAIQENWEQHFEPQMIERGAKYLSQGRVSDLDILPHGLAAYRISANVKGSATRPYRVEVNLLGDLEGDLEIETRCTCRFGDGCKHSAAAIVGAIEVASGAALSTHPHGLQSKTSSLKTSSLSADHRNWLRVVMAKQKNSVNTGSSPQQAPDLESHEIGYSLIIPARAPRTVVEVLPWYGPVGLNTLMIPRGDALLALDFQLREVATKTWETEDRELLIELFFRGWVDSGYKVKAATLELHHIRLFERLLATNRLFLGSVRLQHEAVSTRSLSLSWTQDKQGALRTAISGCQQDEHILAFDEPWVVSKKTGTAARAICDPPTISLTNWLNMPKVAAKDLEKFCRGFQETPLARVVPAPNLEGFKVRSTTPTVCLSVSIAKLSKNAPDYLGDIYYDAQQERLCRAYLNGTLSFCYGEVRVPASSRAVVVLEHAEVDGKPGEIRHQRNMAFEQAAVQILRSDDWVDDEYYTHWLEDRKGSRARGTLYRWDRLFGSKASEGGWKRFLATKVPALRSRGWQVELVPELCEESSADESWFYDVLSNAEQSDAKRGDAKLDDAASFGRPGGETDDDSITSHWFESDLGILLGGKRVSLVPLLTDPKLDELLRNKSLDSVPMIVDGQTQDIPLDRLRAVHQVFEQILNRDDSPSRLLVSTWQGLELLSSLGEAQNKTAFTCNDTFRRHKERLEAAQAVPQRDTPKLLNAELRSYQQRGFEWLCCLRELEFGAVLADDMGLGKTVQSLAFLAGLHEKGQLDAPAMVVCPTSVLPNWQSEIAKFVPHLAVLTSYGFYRRNFWSEIVNANIVLTTYGLLVRDEDWLKAQRFSVIIFDEAQFIKNPATRSYQVAAKLKAATKIICTGTPVENSVRELWAHTNLAVPGLLGNFDRFRKDFERPIEKQGDVIQKRRLAARVKPFVLRRTRKEVLVDLPPVTEICHYVELEGPQRDLYESVRVLMDKRVRDAIREKGFKRSQIEFLDALLKLRQVCCDPRLVKSKGAEKVKQSAKLEALVELVAPLMAEGRQAIIFSQFTSMLDLVAQRLQEQDWKHDFITGQTRDRRLPVERFQKGETPLLLVSLKAGGVGLNLTAADSVFLYDPWWNPAVEEQAIGRAHRMGQNNPVFVYRLITKGSVEEKIIGLQAWKKGLADAVLSEGDEHLMHLGESILVELLGNETA